MSVAVGIALELPSAAWPRKKRRGSATPGRQSDQSPQLVYEVRGSSTSAGDQYRSWSQFYDTEAAALSRLKEIEREYARGGINEFSTDKPLRLRVEKLARAAADLARAVREARDAALNAEKFANKGLTAEERKLGDMLNEYSDRIKDDQRRAVNAKKYLISMTGTIARKQFLDVNNLIESYNRIRGGVQPGMQEAAGSSLLPRFTSILNQYPEIALTTPQDLKGELDSDATGGKFVIWVFKWEGGEWIQQVDRTLNSDNEAQARKYFADVNAVSGWTATSNLAAAKKAPNPVGSLAGTTWLKEDGWGYKFEVGGRALKINPDGKAAYKGRMTWRLENNRVEVQIADVVDFGTIAGDIMTFVGFHIMDDTNKKQKTEYYEPDVFRRASK